MRRWWERRTLRFRLAVWYGVGGTLLLAGFSATLYVFVAQRLAQPLDLHLRRDVEIVRRELAIAPGHRVLWAGRELPDPGSWNPENPWFELWDPEGKLVARLWPFTDNRVEKMPVAPARGRETLSVFNVAQDLRLRVLSVPYEVAGEKQEWMLRVMRVHEPATDALHALKLIIVVALPIVIALLVVGGYLITRRWLMPLDQMVYESNRITVDDLSRRLTVLNPDDELGRLASVFNVTLDRLESSFAALDRFVTDASHELRTPLTTLRSVGEVGLRGSRSVEQYREIIGSMLEEAQRLQLLVQRLLELASAEAGAAETNCVQLQLDEFIAGCVSDMAILAEARHQQLTCDTVPCAVKTDPVIFRQALQNLIDNAIKYSPEGGAVRVTLRETSSEVQISVADEGPGISPGNREHLTQRFFRPDRSRGRVEGGFGLGLSITKAYMRVLSGSLSYEAGPTKGSVFHLTLPKRPA